MPLTRLPIILTQVTEVICREHWNVVISTMVIIMILVRLRERANYASFVDFCALVVFSSTSLFVVMCVCVQKTFGCTNCCRALGKTMQRGISLKRVRTANDLKILCYSFSSIFYDRDSLSCATVALYEWNICQQRKKKVEIRLNKIKKKFFAIVYFSSTSSNKNYTWNKLKHF